MIRFLTESRQINVCENSSVVNRISDILKYEELAINTIIKTLEDEEFFDLILNCVYPKKYKKEIILDLENYAEKPKMNKKRNS